MRHARILGEWRTLRRGAGLYTADLPSPDTGDMCGLIVGHRPDLPGLYHGQTEEEQARQGIRLGRFHLDGTPVAQGKQVE